MDRKQESPLDTKTPQQTEAALRLAKERLAGQAEKLSLKEAMAKHPYIALGAAFLCGTLVGGSREAREDIARILTDVISKEVLHRGKK